MNCKPVPMVVLFVLVPLLLLSVLLGVLLWQSFQARVELIGSTHDGISQMFDNLGDQELELLCPPNSVELWDLFLQWYFVPDRKSVV